MRANDGRIDGMGFRGPGAGSGDRTRMASLEGWNFTIKLCPPIEPGLKPSKIHIGSGSQGKFRESGTRRAKVEPVEKPDGVEGRRFQVWILGVTPQGCEYEND